MAKQINLGDERFALVDDGDFEVLSQWKWVAIGPRGRLYASRTAWDGARHRRVMMHREILGVSTGSYVDHINNNPLDNRRENLRLCSVSQNAANAPGRGAGSGFKGVTLHRRSGRYYAHITVDGRSRHLGSFTDPAVAARAYDAAAVQHFGEFAWVNFKAAA